MGLSGSWSEIELTLAFLELKRLYSSGSLSEDSIPSHCLDLWWLYTLWSPLFFHHLYLWCMENRFRMEYLERPRASHRVHRPLGRTHLLLLLSSWGKGHWDCRLKLLASTLWRSNAMWNPYFLGSDLSKRTSLLKSNRAYSIQKASVFPTKGMKIVL